jgi:hypothetical protein
MGPKLRAPYEALWEEHAATFSPLRFARLLTNLYSAFSNPLLERLDMEWPT